MEGLQLIGISICITTVVTTIFSMLVPDNHLDKILKFAISLFFLTGIVSPFINNKLNFNIVIDDIIENQSQSQLSLKAENQFLGLAGKNIESEAEKILKNANIFPQKIRVDININEDDSISINEMMVYIKKEALKDQTQEIKKLIKENMGITAEVTVMNTNSTG